MTFLEWIQNVLSGDVVAALSSLLLLAAGYAGVIWGTRNLGNHKVLKYLPGLVFLILGVIAISLFPSMTWLCVVGFILIVLVVLPWACDDFLPRTEPSGKYTYVPLAMMLISTVLLILPAVYTATKLIAETAQEQAVRAAYAQEEFYATNGKYTSDADVLKEYDAKLNTRDLKLAVSGTGETSFFTVSAFTSSMKARDGGFGIQGNRNGVIATCSFSNQCVDGEWDVAAATPDNLGSRSRFPIVPDGSQGVGVSLQQIPLNESCGVIGSPYTADSPFANRMPSNCE